MTDQERKDWDELANMLGVTRANRQLGVGLIRVQAMLHGLACLECNGSVTFSAGRSDFAGWFWEYVYHDGSHGHGQSNSHPAALIAMLKAHRGIA